MKLFLLLSIVNYISGVNVKSATPAPSVNYIKSNVPTTLTNAPTTRAPTHAPSSLAPTYSTDAPSSYVQYTFSDANENLYASYFE
jgi:hypothetical protein